MASSTTRTRTIRLRNEVADWLDEIDARAAVESAYDLVAIGSLVFEGCFLKIPENKKAYPPEWIRIAQVCDEVGISCEEAADRFVQFVYREMA